MTMAGITVNTLRSPIGGRPRFVIVMALVVGFAGLVLGLVEGLTWDWWEYALAGLGCMALGAILAYALYGLFALFQWVLEGFDEPGRRYFIYFFGAAVLTVSLGVAFVLLRHEVSGLYVEDGKCWYAVRDRWTGEVRFEHQTCRKGKGSERWVTRT
ncbi:MAG: hypothetical protein KIT68_11135 [Phycisphaeraceae bacterium]|nr:hypothetical protein [Phycisphaeraceae bacterium]